MEEVSRASSNSRWWLLAALLFAIIAIFAQMADHHLALLLLIAMACSVPFVATIRRFNNGFLFGKNLPIDSLTGVLLVSAGTIGIWWLLVVSKLPIWNLSSVEFGLIIFSIYMSGFAISLIRRSWINRRL
jgi:hypothetical protein